MNIPSRIKGVTCRTRISGRDVTVVPKSAGIMQVALSTPPVAASEPVADEPGSYPKAVWYTPEDNSSRKYVRDDIAEGWEEACKNLIAGSADDRDRAILLIGLLERAREYVADDLDAHEHSDGRELLNEIDAALSPPPPAAASEPVADFVCELAESKMDDDCGCLEEFWDTSVGVLHMHLSPGKNSNACLDCGDEGERHIDLTAATVEEARAAFFGWAGVPLYATPPAALSRQPEGEG